MTFHAHSTFHVQQGFNNKNDKKGIQLFFQCTGIWTDLFFPFRCWCWFILFSLNRIFLQVFDLSSINPGTEVVSWQIWFPGLSLCCHDRVGFRWIKNWVLCCFLFSLKLAYTKCVCSLQGKSVMFQKFVILLFFIFNITNNCRKWFWDKLQKRWVVKAREEQEIKRKNRLRTILILKKFLFFLFCWRLTSICV